MFVTLCQWACDDDDSDDNDVTDADGPVPLELPNQWLWDIIDEFIYQVPSSYSCQWFLAGSDMMLRIV